MIVCMSVIAQLGQMPTNLRTHADVSSLGEQGFLACTTEERVLGTMLALKHVPPREVDVALLGIRAEIKRHLRDLRKIADEQRSK